MPEDVELLAKSSQDENADYDVEVELRQSSDALEQALKRQQKKSQDATNG